MKFNFKRNTNRVKTPKSSNSNRTLYIILAVALIALISLFSSASFITELQWFNEVGYTRTYLTRIMAVIGLTLPIFVIFYTI